MQLMPSYPNADDAELVAVDHEVDFTFGFCLVRKAANW